MVIMQAGSLCYYFLHKDEAEVVEISVKVKNGKHWQSGKMLKFLHAECHILVPTTSRPYNALDRALAAQEQHAPFKWGNVVDQITLR